MLKLRRLKINRYRNVRPGAELAFSDGHNILLGRNGTGKTTLLNLISNLFRLSLEELCREEMAVELELGFSGGHATLNIQTASAAPTAPDLRPPEDERTAERASRASSALEFGACAVVQLEGQPGEGRLETTSVGMRGQVGSEVHEYEVSPGDWTLVDMILEGLITLHASHVATATGLPPGPQQAQPAAARLRGLERLLRFDESLKVLEESYSRSPLLTLRTLGPRNRFVSSPGQLPDDVKALLEARFLEDPSLTELRITHRDSPALREVARILEFREVELRVSLVEKNVKGPMTTVYSFGNPLYLFTRRNGSIVPLDQLSYGQKRMVAFNLYLGANLDMVVADELVNGLHHQWIEECMAAIGERQTFLTSQNPLLLDYLSFPDVEQVKRTFVMCRLLHSGDEDELLWGNMSQAEAEMFFSAYEVGLQQVGEILQTRGLW